MKQAIVTGSTGLLGMALVKHLSSVGIRVLCLGRKSLNPTDIKQSFGDNSTYLKLPMKNILSLEKKLEEVGWTSLENCIFYHFAWGGSKALTDGSFNEQLNNAVYAANAVKVARKIGCSKFVNVGTLEETYAEQYLQKKNHLYNFSQSNYTVSKLASRNLCKMVAYLEKIDYVHTRISIPLIPDLSKGSYLASTLKKIFNGESYEKPTNRQLFDIILTDDTSKAYHLIGKHGVNKADYFIGTTRPDTLGGYFERFESYMKGMVEEKITLDRQTKLIFDSSKLNLDTGFTSSSDLKDIIKNLRES
jgi:nucleoside-diphosphate-sugar epimerase